MTAIAGATGVAPANLNNMIIIGLVGLSIVVAALYWFINNRTLANRQTTVSERQTEADKLEAIIKEVEDFQRRKDSLQNRIDLINQLKQNQKGPVRIMDQISRDLPDLVWLDKMTVAGGSVSISGRGLNPNAIANYVENIKNDPYFEEPALNDLTEAASAGPNKATVYSFDMDFKFSYTPKTPGAAPGTPGATGTGTTGTTSTTGTGARPGGAPVR